MNQELRFSSEYEISIAVTANSPKAVSRSIVIKGGPRKPLERCCNPRKKTCAFRRCVSP
jgi:hypothetical protein